jgi:hypothetical protein
MRYTPAAQDIWYGSVPTALAQALSGTCHTLGSESISTSQLNSFLQARRSKICLSGLSAT